MKSNPNAPIKRLMDRLVVPEAIIAYLAFLMGCRNKDVSPGNWLAESDYFPDCFSLTRTDIDTYLTPAIDAVRENGLISWNFIRAEWEGYVSKQQRDGKDADRSGLEAYYRARLCEAGNEAYTGELPEAFYTYAWYAEKRGQKEELVCSCQNHDFTAPAVLTGIVDTKLTTLYLRLEPKATTHSDMLTLLHSLRRPQIYVADHGTSTFHYIVPIKLEDLPDVVWDPTPSIRMDPYATQGNVGAVLVPFNDAFVQALKSVLSEQRVKVADICWPH